MTDHMERVALRELGRISVRLKLNLAAYHDTRLPAELVAELLDIVRRAEIILENAAREVPRKG